MEVHSINADLTRKSHINEALHILKREDELFRDNASAVTPDENTRVSIGGLIIALPELKTRHWSSLKKGTLHFLNTTVSINRVDYEFESYRAVSTLFDFGIPSSIGMPISKKEARRIALRIHAEIECGIQQDRAEEARYIQGLLDDE